MKKLFTLIVAVATFQVSFGAVVTDTVSVGALYANQIWYSLPNDEQGTSPKDNWDVAFEISGYAGAILANTQKSLSLYQSPFTVAQWATVDTTGISAWVPLQNSDTTWAAGAFNSSPDGNTDLGWGDYDMNTHVVSGDSVFVIKLANGDWKKFRINSLTSGTYSFTWANLDGTSEQTASIAKSNYTGKNFGYFSLETNTALDREPTTGTWDFTFTKYITTLYTPAPTPYGVTGALLNKNVKAIKASTVNVNTVDYNAYTFKTAINTIGYDWKAYTGGAWVIEDSLAYFVKRGNGDIWKVIFTGFTGSGTGNYIFSKELVFTAPTGIEETNEVKMMNIYPNPAHNQFQVIYDYANSETKNTEINIFDVTGRIVKQENFNLINGFNQHTVDVSSLNAGIYLISIPGLNKTQKLIVE